MYFNPQLDIYKFWRLGFYLILGLLCALTISQAFAIDPPNAPIHLDDNPNANLSSKTGLGYDNDQLLEFQWNVVAQEKNYNVYLSVDGGPFQLESATFAPQYTLLGVNGHFYQIRVTSIANGEESNYSQPSNKIVVDTVPPEIPILQFKDPLLVNTAKLVVLLDPLTQTNRDPNFDAYQLRGGQFADWTTTQEMVDFAFQLQPNATNSLQIRGIDLAGNPSPAAVLTVIQDSIPPTAPILAPLNRQEASPHRGDKSGAVNTPTIGLKVDVPSSDLHFSHYQAHGGQYKNWTSVTETEFFAFELAQNTENLLSVRGVDKAGNVGEAVTVRVMHDAIPPQVPGQPFAREETAPGSGFASSFPLTWEWTPAKDNFLVDSYQVFVVVDGQPPTPFNKGDGGDFTLAGTAKGPYFPLAVATGRSYQVRVQAVDAAGNLGDFSQLSRPIFVDMTNPTTPSIRIREPDVLSGNLVDADTILVDLVAPSEDDLFWGYQLLGGQYSTWTDTTETTIFKFNLVQDRVNVLSVRGQDKAGNVSGTATIQVIEDSTPPTPPIVRSTRLATRENSVVVELVAPSVDPFFDSYELRGGQYSDWTRTTETNLFRFQLQSDQINSLFIRAKDQLGHRSEPVEIQAVQDLIPPGRPGVPRHYDSTAATIGFDDDTTLDFQWTPAQDNFAAVTDYLVFLSIDGLPYEEISKSFGPAFSVSVPEGHTYRLQVAAVDQAGNVGPRSEASLPVLIDTTPPTAPVIEPVASFTSAFEVELLLTPDGQSFDANGVKYQIRGGKLDFWMDVSTTDKFRFFLIPNAQNTLSIRAVDPAGNQRINSVQITQDSIPPIAPGKPNHIKPEEALVPNLDNSQALKFVWSAAEDNFEVDHYRVFISKNGGAFKQDERKISLPAIQSPYVAAGENGNVYQIRVRAVDKAGNISPESPPSEVILVDTEAPIVEQVEILGDHRVTGKVTKGDGKVQIKARIKDATITEEGITADLSQLTGNSEDRAVNPIARNLVVFDNFVQVNWFTSLNQNIQGGSVVTVTISARDNAGNLAKENSAQAYVFVPSASQETLLSLSTDGEVIVFVELKPSTIPDRRVLPLRVVVEPVDAEVATADENLPKQMYILKGSVAYKIIAEDILGVPIPKEQIRDTFTLGLGYSSEVGPEVAQNLKLFVLSGNNWLPLESQVDFSRRMVKTEAASQFGIYRLLAQASTTLEDILAYPNPVRFGNSNNTLKFRNVPPEAVIEIYTVTGERIREIKVEPGALNVAWDGKKKNGDLVTSGLYLYRIRMNDKEVFGKIAVLR